MMGERKGGDERSDCRVSMKLFVAGADRNSLLARQNLDKVCLECPEIQCDLEIIDVLEDYGLAVGYNVLVAPTLIIEHGAQPIKIIGTLSDLDHLQRILKTIREDLCEERGS